MSGTTQSEKMVQQLDKLYEYDREPVSNDRLHGGWRFAGMYAGEHVAATEFVIGALFVSWGASVADVLGGLLLGNLLAVLSWALICAPIATQTRLTLYWYLRRIVGPQVTAIYNVLNAVLYCILAGSMITVSASAVRMLFDIPPQTAWLPTDLRFVLVVLAVGAVVVGLAIWGFTKLAQFATLCAPWMIVMFVGGALVTWSSLASSVPVEEGQVAGFFEVASARIWTGVPAAGGEPIGFWHIAAFAWICNIAMHLGLSDLAIFRYARKSVYGLNSAFGMLLGHYVAWIAAGIMGAAAALALQQPLLELDSGAVAFHALGIAGAIAVVIAGWTTSNPTLYRAGLALQAVTPNWPRWKVTLVAGALTTVVACSPFVFTKLLGFVGIYGILLAPVGGIVTAYHFLLPRMGLGDRSSPAGGPALVAWMVASLGSVVLWQTGAVHLFFLAVPAWLVSALLFAVLVKFTAKPEEAGAPKPESPAAVGHQPPPPPPSPPPLTPFTRAAGVVALFALITCLALPLGVFFTSSAALHDSFKTLLLIASILYFVSGSIWIYRQTPRTR
jgi:cytosine permease